MCMPAVCLLFRLIVNFFVPFVVLLAGCEVTACSFQQENAD